MKLKSIKQIKNLAGQRVLLRVDFNVSLGDNLEVDGCEDFRLRRVLPTIDYLTKAGAKVILLSHLGRPHGKKNKSLRLTPIARRLTTLLKRKIVKLDDCIGKKVEQHLDKMHNGNIVLLENLRFHIGEEKNSDKFAKDLAILGDIFINDAFAVSHRRAASLVAITKYLPSYAGLLILSEVEQLTKFFSKPKKPLVVVLGGAKIETKVKLIDSIAKKVDYLLIGGGLANNFIAAAGNQVGKSLVEKDMMTEVKQLYKKYSKKIIIPTDVTVDDVKTKKLEACQKDLIDIKQYDRIIDIGTKTVLEWSDVIKQAKTIFWNGPLGIVEDKKSSHASRALTELIAARSKRKCFTVLGGGETVWLIQDMNLFASFDYISTGGGAMLDFLEKKNLPGLKPLLK